MSQLLLAKAFQQYIAGIAFGSPTSSPKSSPVFHANAVNCSKVGQTARYPVIRQFARASVRQFASSLVCRFTDSTLIQSFAASEVNAE